MTNRKAETQAEKTPEDWWSTVDHRHEARHDPLSRLCHRGPDRPRGLCRHGLSADARRAAASGGGEAAGGRAGRGGRPRPAGALDRRRPHGGDLRRRHQQRHGVGDQHAGRRAWRRRRASVALYNAVAARLGGAADDKRMAKAIDGRDRRAGEAGRPPRAGLRPPLPSARSARAAPAGAGRRRGEVRRGQRALRRDRPRHRGAACREAPAMPCR